MANVLIATLGESPIVVTAMVKALKGKKRIPIETVHVLYPSVETDRLIHWGYEIIEDHLKNVCQVQPGPLNFADSSTSETSIEFLQALNAILDQHERTKDNVYLSLAGGRKNMSALLAVISQFYPCVKGLYHLLDKFEYDTRRRNFYTIEQLVEMSEIQQVEKLSPDVDNLKLVEIPYTQFANAGELRRYFTAEKRGEDYTVETSGLADAFFGAVFQPNRSAKLLNVYLSETAYAHFQKFSGDRRKTFLKYFEQMQDPYALKGHIHGTFGATDKIFHFMKLRRTAERPFYYTSPNPITLFPKQSVEDVIVCGLSIEKGGPYEPPGELLEREARTVPYKRVSELFPDDKSLLLVPLGESPMIATQTYTLLQEQEGLQVSLLAVLYPEGHAPARNAANLLEDLCERRNIPFEKKPVALKDVDNYNACRTYLDAIGQVINDLRIRYPNSQIALSLSGGRKGMSALSLFAAQKAGIEYVYHTVITDPALEKQIERECGLEGLDKFTPSQQAERLFLDIYDHAQFDLFRIPVIPIN